MMSQDESYDSNYDSMVIAITFLVIALFVVTAALVIERNRVPEGYEWKLQKKGESE